MSPWTGKGFRDKHNHDLTDRQAEEAARIANSILDRTGDEGKAVRIANALVKKARRLGNGR